MLTLKQSFVVVILPYKKCPHLVSRMSILVHYEATLTTHTHICPPFLENVVTPLVKFIFPSYVACKGTCTHKYCIYLKVNDLIVFP